MSHSWKVVNIAHVFCASFNRAAILSLIRDIFVRRSVLAPKNTVVTSGAGFVGALDFAAGAGGGGLGGAMAVDGGGVDGAAAGVGGGGATGAAAADSGVGSGAAAGSGVAALGGAAAAGATSVSN